CSNDDDDNDDPTPRSPALHIHINATTTIQGNNNRIMLPSPTSTQEHLGKLVTLAVKDVLPSRALSSSSASGDGIEEGEVGEQMIEVTLDAGTRIEGNGNVVVYRKVSGEASKGIGEDEEKGRKKRRAGSVS
ncbi:MAG: hypothetical protein Q9216_002514, partial [Gyalolechia sp. 2 TL-2023]